mgnify:CR=1 FL=1
MFRLHRRPLHAAALLLALQATPLAAQMLHIPQYTGTPLLVTGGVLDQQVLQDAGRKAPAAGPPREATVVPVAGPPQAPGLLARAYPAARRGEAERLFADLLQRYRTIEQRFDIPHRDLAGALAAFIAGNHMAFHGAPFPDAHFKPLVAQMRRLLAAQPGLARAPAAERQQAWEQLAILGMFMAGAQIAQQRQPDAQQAVRLREAGGANLQRLLAVAPDQVLIGPQGLALAGR